MRLPLPQGDRQEALEAASQGDWTNLFDRPSVIRLTNQLIDELVQEIHGRRFGIHLGLDARELALLYRFPLHVGVNIF